MRKRNIFTIAIASLALTLGVGAGLKANKVEEVKAESVTYTYWVEFKSGCRWDSKVNDSKVKFGLHVWNSTTNSAYDTPLVELEEGIQFVKYSFTTDVNPNKAIAGRFTNAATSFVWEGDDKMLNRTDNLDFDQSNAWIELNSYGSGTKWCTAYSYTMSQNVHLYVNGSEGVELSERIRGGDTHIEAYKTDVLLAQNDVFEIDENGTKYSTTSVQPSIASNFDLTGSKPKCLVAGSYDLYYDLDDNELWIQMAADAEAEAYADYFLANFTCGGTTGPNAGKVTAEEGTWGTLSSKWTPMSSGAKEYFNVQPNEEGTKFQQVLARYKYVIEKYGTGTYNDFMGKGYTKVDSNVLAPLVVESNSTNVALIIVIVSTISLVALGGFFFIKRKKEN